MKNREIKFRVWHHSFSRFLTPDEWGLDLDGKLLFIDFTIDDWKLVESGYTIQQYTGLKDKNDKEIYEGDIVKTEFGHMFSSNIHVVEYIKNRFVPDDVCDTDGVEVIGNIFETLDLVK